MLKYDCLQFYRAIMFLLSSLHLREGWLWRTKAFQGCSLLAHEHFSPDCSNNHAKYILKSFFIMFCLITFEIEVSFLVLRINIELTALINTNQNYSLANKRQNVLFLSCMWTALVSSMSRSVGDQHGQPPLGKSKWLDTLSPSSQEPQPGACRGPSLPSLCLVGLPLLLAHFQQGLLCSFSVGMVSTLVLSQETGESQQTCCPPCPVEKGAMATPTFERKALICLFSHNTEDTPPTPSPPISSKGKMLIFSPLLILFFWKKLSRKN